MDHRLPFKRAALLALPVPRKGRATYIDSKCQGLRLRITSSGHRSFCLEVRSKVTGEKRRVTIGTFPEDISIEQARDAANTLRETVKKGGTTPQDDRRRKRDTTDPRGATVRQVLEHYITAKSDLSREKPLRPGSAKAYREVLGVVLGKKMDEPLLDLSGAAIQHLYFAYAKNSVSQARSAMRGLRALFYYWPKLHRDELGPMINPVSDVIGGELKPLPPKTTRLEGGDLKTWWQAVHKLPAHKERTTAQYEAVRDLLVFLLLTGCRLDEVRLLKWEHVSLQEKNFTISSEAAKNAQQVQLPLCDYLILMLRQRPKQTEYVFENERTGLPIDLRSAQAHLDRDCGFHQTRHDLRRTYAKFGEECDVSWIALKRLMNHKVSDITSQYSWDGKLTQPMRDGNVKITNAILEKCGALENVRKLRVAK